MQIKHAAKMPNLHMFNRQLVDALNIIYVNYRTSELELRQARVQWDLKDQQNVSSDSRKLMHCHKFC